MQEMEKLEDSPEHSQEISYPLPLAERQGMGRLQKEKKNVVFRVYCKDYLTRSMILLGKIVERRAKERGNNLKDLLVRAVKDYSDCVGNPSTIFLLGS